PLTCATSLPTKSNTLSLHDALPIFIIPKRRIEVDKFEFLPYRFEIHEYNWEDITDPVDFVVLESLINGIVFKGELLRIIAKTRRSEEHTSELQSRENLVCRLLLEKK